MGTEFLDKTGLTHLWEQITGKMSNYIPTSQKNAASGVAGLDSSGKIASSLLSTIPINKGGTGATSASAALTNLGAAAVSHKHAASDITSGTLAVARGGTGASDAATARTNLGITPANIGAEAANTCLPLAGGTMAGYIDFGSNSNGLSWTTANGTVWHLRPYAPNNLFQLTFKPTDGDEYGAVSINANGVMSLYSPLPITSGGTGATDAATARSNLGALTYKQYDNGYFETGAGNTSAWFQFQVSGETKCQMDMFSDGKVGIGGKTVLVAGDVIGYTKYNTNKLAMDSWLDNNAYTLALRDDGTDKCVLAMWNGGALTVNGSIVATEGRDNTFSGTLTVSNNNSAGGYVKIWEDNEGGNIEIGSKSGYNYQMDAYNDILRLYSQKSGGVVQLAACDGSTGAWDFPFLTVNKLELDGKESQTLQMRNATSDTSEVSITFYQGSTQRWTLGAGCGSAGNDFTLWDHTNSTLALDMRSNKYLYVYGNWVYDQRSVVYSSTAPTDVYTGKIWLKPV